MSTKPRTRKVILGVLAGLVVLGAAYFAVSRYLESLPNLDYTMAEPPVQVTSHPDARFAVMSDIHYYDTSLGTSGEAFEEVLGSDRKLLQETADLLDLAIEDVLAAGVDFVLIPGDLTKDGEVVNHEAAATALGRLRDSGVGVYVVPGNHDANNPEAFEFDGAEKIPVPAVSQEEFAEVYEGFGYGAALMRDQTSLSYVAEPVDGLWLLALDATRSEENEPGGEEVTAGAFTQAQVDWIEEVLQEARAGGVAVIAMMHHGVVEHWEGQSKLHPEYLVEDYPSVGALLASYGVRVVFTGHYHAQDIARGDFGEDGFLYDIETGSLATAPCPVRYCDLSGSELAVRSETIVDRLRPGTSFGSDARAFVLATIASEAYDVSRGYNVAEDQSRYIADHVAPAFVAHYEGDENLSAKPPIDNGQLDLWGRFIWSQQRYVADGLWADPAPADNDVVLSLTE
ncbi:MAG: metallophosphoesterase [Coriobacteriia bacterium]|nr:metallophosphoesterase [Coriobacteriia bacterium]MBN2840836.1 metallophosphoesterase [Coriobacteriia bacterium]